MFHLADALPWHIWLLLGAVGIPLMLKWVIQSKNDPILLRVSGVMFAGIMFMAVLHNLIRGTGKYTDYLAIIIQTSIPLIMLATILMIIGGYQKVIHPGYDPAKRRMFIICTYLMSGVLVCMGLIFLAIIYI